MTLEPGDIIVTGTPSGVGHARKPPVWMKAGDTIEIDIQNVGVLHQPDRGRSLGEFRRIAAESRASDAAVSIGFYRAHAPRKDGVPQPLFGAGTGTRASMLPPRYDRAQCGRT